MMRFVVARALTVIALAAIAAPAFATDYRGTRCQNCPAPRNYDSQEVVHTTKDVDHSRVINTQTVVPVSKRFKTTNHLVIRKNTIRHVGVVRHKHTIIEKEIRYRRPVYARARPIVVNFVTQKYRTVHRPAMVRDTMTVYPRRAVLRVRG
jgi:hypothetical protein